MKMEIRKAKARDAERLCELGNQFLEQISNCSPTCRIEKLNVDKKNIASWANGIIKPEKDSYTFVAEENGNILGYIEFAIEKNEPSQFFKVKQYGWIECIVIDEKIKGKGIGQKLFDYAIGLFREKKIRFVRLSVFLKNKGARDFWKKNGFWEDSLEMIRAI